LFHDKIENMKKQNSKAVLQVEITARQQELLALMLQKANVSADMIMEDALKRWVVKNADLLTEKEVKNFADLLPSLQPKPKPKPKTKPKNNA
jgi:hypothetical protein